MSLLKCRQEGLTEKEEEVSEVSSSSDHLNSVESNLDCIELPPYSAIASDRTVAVANTLQQLQGSRVFFWVTAKGSCETHQFICKVHRYLEPDGACAWQSASSNPIRTDPGSTAHIFTSAYVVVHGDCCFRISACKVFRPQSTTPLSDPSMAQQ